jgi:TonB family protein
LLLVSLALCDGAAAARQSATSQDVTRGVELYLSGDAEGSARLLRAALKRDEKNAEGWYFLGLALSRAGRVKEARGAFRKAIDLRPSDARARAGLAYMLLLGGKLKDAEAEARQSIAEDAKQADAHYVLGAVLLLRDREEEALEEAEAALALNPKFTAALILKGNAIANLYTEHHERMAERHAVPKRPDPEQEEALARRRDALTTVSPKLFDAAAAFEAAASLEPNSPHAAGWRAQAETLRLHAGPNDAVYSANRVTTKAVVLSKPDPLYPDDARRDGVSGMVRMRVVFAADGKVRHIFILKSADPRLARVAMAAARAINFKPAIKDGVEVSQFAVLEYYFNIH